MLTGEHGAIKQQRELLVQSVRSGAESIQGMFRSAYRCGVRSCTRWQQRIGTAATCWQGWCSSPLDAPFCVKALEESQGQGSPAIFNDDRGARFTSEVFASRLEG